MTMDTKKAAWRLQGLLGQFKSLRKQGVLTVGEELAARAVFTKALARVRPPKLPDVTPK